MNYYLSIMGKTALAILAIWFIATIWVETSGPKKIVHFGEDDSNNTALVVFDPDPIYNLDEQLCLAYGKALAEKGWAVTVASVKAASDVETSFDHLAFCANTYNWAPDWAVVKFIKKQQLQNKPVVAITVGSGSTKGSQRRLEKLIVKQGGQLIESASYWLMRPNDEAQNQTSNVAVAVDLAYRLGLTSSEKLAKQ